MQHQILAPFPGTAHLSLSPLQRTPCFAPPLVSRQALGDIIRVPTPPRALHNSRHQDPLPSLPLEPPLLAHLSHCYPYSRRRLLVKKDLQELLAKPAGAGGGESGSESEGGEGKEGQDEEEDPEEVLLREMGEIKDRWGISCLLARSSALVAALASPACGWLDWSSWLLVCAVGY
jgi:hypothetical protein